MVLYWQPNAVIGTMREFEQLVEDECALLGQTCSAVSGDAKRASMWSCVQRWFWSRTSVVDEISGAAGLKSKGMRVKRYSGKKAGVQVPDIIIRQSVCRW